MHECSCKRVCERVCVCICVYVSVCVHDCENACVHVCSYMCVHACDCACDCWVYVCTIACMWNSEENFSGVDSLPPCFYHSAYSKTVALAFPADVPISVSFLCSPYSCGSAGITGVHIRLLRWALRGGVRAQYFYLLSQLLDPVLCTFDL